MQLRIRVSRVKTAYSDFPMLYKIVEQIMATTLQNIGKSEKVVLTTTKANTQLHISLHNSRRASNRFYGSDLFSCPILIVSRRQIHSIREKNDFLHNVSSRLSRSYGEGSLTNLRISNCDCCGIRAV